MAERPERIEHLRPFVNQPAKSYFALKFILITISFWFTLGIVQGKIV